MIKKHVLQEGTVEGNTDFTVRVSSVIATSPQPGRRPAADTFIGHERMVSEQHGRDPFLYGLPVLADPER